MYILHSHIIAHVLNSAINDILTQPDLEGQRGKWIEVLLEYDLEIKPTKLIKGQGLAKLMAQSKCDALNLHMILELSIEEQNPKEQPDPEIAEYLMPSPWYADIIFMLHHLQAPQEMDRTRAIFLNKKATKFFILNGKLYWKEPRGVLLNYVNEHDAKKIM